VPLRRENNDAQGNGEPIDQLGLLRDVPTLGLRVRRLHRFYLAETGSVFGSAAD